MTNYKYFGYLYHQRVDNKAIPFFIFTGHAKEVKKWAGIRRTIETKEGNQRVLRPARQKSITHFLESDSINTIPNNILVAFDKKVAKFVAIEEKLGKCIDIKTLKNNCGKKIQWGFLEFSNNDASKEQDKAAFLVDGQHRLYGIASINKEEIPILVVALIGADQLEQAFQFIVINSKQVKVPTDNIKSIIADFDEESLEERVLNAGVKFGDHSPLLRQINDMNSSPFKGLLTWDYNREKDPTGLLVPVTAIEQSLKFLQSLFEFLNEDTDSLIDIFNTIWTCISKRYVTLWKKESKFMTKVNINALTELTGIFLKGASRSKFIDILDPVGVSGAVRRYFEDVPADFWTMDWTIKIQDNANVRKLIIDDIDLIKENVGMQEDWLKDLKLPETTVVLISTAKPVQNTPVKKAAVKKAVKKKAAKKTGR